MTGKTDHAHLRRARKRLRSALRRAEHALNESARLAGANQFTKAARAAQFGERHAKLAAQLIDLGASLQQIAAARHRARMAIVSAAADAEAKLACKIPRVTSPDTDPADMTRDWSARDPRVRTLLKTAMEKEREREARD